MAKIKIWPTVTLGPIGLRIVHQFVETHYTKVGQIYVTAGTNGVHVKGSYHYGRIYNGSPAAAVDFGFLDGVSAHEGAVRGRDFAKWLYDYFGGDIIELIHMTPFADDHGFYVKNGKRMPGGGVYSLALRKAHLNHVHLAMSAHQLDVMLAAYAKQHAAAAERARQAALKAAAKSPAPSASPLSTVPVLPTTTGGTT